MLREIEADVLMVGFDPQADKLVHELKQSPGKHKRERGADDDGDELHQELSGMPVGQPVGSLCRLGCKPKARIVIPVE